MPKAKIKVISPKIKVREISKEDKSESEIHANSSNGESFSSGSFRQTNTSLPSRNANIESTASNSIPSTSVEREIKGQVYQSSMQGLERQRKYEQARQTGTFQPGFGNVVRTSQTFQPEALKVKREPSLGQETLEESMEKKYDIHNPQNREKQRRKLPWEI